MKLYYAPGSCGLASQIALREAGKTFNLVKVDFKTKTTIEGDYRKVTPKGFIPVLQLDNGDQITEGAVILQWIADQNPEHALIPPFGTRERYTVLEWLNFIASDLHKGMAVMFSSVVDDENKKRFAEANLIGKFEYIDEHLSTHDYVLGTQFSVADAYLFNVLSWPPRVNLDISRYGAIQRFMARMAQRDSVHASLEAEGLQVM
ncbi:glutathione S-transferase [Paraburkholderia terrae]|jgi:glutathione S-transferase|uniref:Glutathione S-transferase n=1 Tax=Paraburkholderia terrae TaxID=311230 RepID=A0ABM7U0J8_9BURK|nr:glutathione transferase GstA [Paraburkholderia terrae]BCZ84774.1 glutathione S-transferase [Paraburkholderia terrae]